MSLATQAQEEDEPKNWAIDGYVKQLQTIYLTDLDNVILDNLIHHRLNFQWYINDNFNFKADMRNRIFYGNQVQLVNQLQPMRFADQINDANNDVLDLSAIVLDRDAIVMHTMIDRLYLDYAKNNWEVRLGRQRINWGINLAWNPNDIFNTYSFFDFDYEERPGSDALKIQYNTGYASNVQLAIKAFTEVEDIVAAGFWQTNKWNTDFQFLGGVFHEDIVIGGGWAGSLKSAGFKGEVTAFMPYDNLGDSVEVAATLGLDYLFSNSTYLYAGFLFSSTGETSGDILNTFGTNAVQNAKNLYPYKYSLLTQVMYPFTPIFSGGLSFIYSPSEDNAMFMNPTFTLSIKENWDLDFVGQLFFMNDGTDYTMPLAATFVRVKWSY